MVTKDVFKYWWLSYVTSKLTSLCVNFIVCVFLLQTSFLAQLFDFLTFDIDLTFEIFLTVCHLLDILTLTYCSNHIDPSQGYFVNAKNRPGEMLIKNQLTLDVKYTGKIVTHGKYREFHLVQNVATLFIENWFQIERKMWVGTEHSRNK